MLVISVIARLILSVYESLQYRCIMLTQLSAALVDYVFMLLQIAFFFFFSSRRRHTRYWRDWSSDVCSSDLEAFVAGASRDGLRLKVRLSAGDQILADDTYAVVNGEVHRRIALSDPGIDDFRNELLWSPSCPTLIDARVELWGGRGQLLDAVDSYTALRSVAVQGDQFLLNGRPYRLRLALDQGYWPESGLTPPSDEALRRDVSLAKA